MIFVDMYHKYISLLLALWAVTINASIEPLSTLINSNIAFSKKFTTFLYEEHVRENVVCSPLSAHVILGLTAHGTRGTTGMQLYNALCLPNSKCLLAQNYHDLIKDFQNVENVTISLANRIYTNKNLELNTKYQNLAEESFFSEVVAMKGTPKEFVEDANKWADEKTNHKINTIISEDDVLEDNSLILLNAIYFKGNWESPFSPEDTIAGTFYTFNNIKLKTQMMIKTKATFEHGKIPRLNSEFVILPYKNPNYKMVIIMPEGNKPNLTLFYEVGKKLRNFDYEELGNYSGNNSFVFVMPKFTVESNLDLNLVLEKMGVTEIFTDEANFQTISKNPNNQLKVKSIIQKAFIEVNENGSEAAVASKVSITLKSSLDNLYINKPFYFAIVTPQGTLFDGKIVSPKS